MRRDGRWRFGDDGDVRHIAVLLSVMLVVWVVVAVAINAVL